MYINWYVCIYIFIYIHLGFPGGTSGKEPACQYRRHKRCRFNPWVGKIPWRKAWRPFQYSCLENLYRQKSLAGCHPWGCKESDMNEAAEHACTHSLRHTYYYNIIQMLWQLVSICAQEKNSILIFLTLQIKKYFNWKEIISWHIPVFIMGHYNGPFIIPSHLP